MWVVARSLCVGIKCGNTPPNHEGNPPTMSSPAPAPPVATPHRGPLPILRVEALDILRRDLGVSVPDLADRISSDRSHLWRVLNGKSTATPDIISRCLVELATILRDQPAHRG